MKCPDCNSIKIVPFDEQGDGRCSVCHGGGVGGVLDEIADGLNPFGRGHITCYKCDGSGQCQTCGGTGKVSGEPDDAATDEVVDDDELVGETSSPREDGHSSSDESDSSPTDHSSSSRESRSSNSSFWVVVLILAVVGGIFGGLFSPPRRSSFSPPYEALPRVEDRRKPTPWSDVTTYYPPCVASDEVLKIVDIMDLYRVAHITVRPDCWSQWVQPPLGMYETNSSAEWEIMFKNGKRVLTRPGEKVDLGIVEGPIRLRGSGGEVTIKVY